MVMYKIDRRGGVQKSYTRTDPLYFMTTPKSQISLLPTYTISRVYLMIICIERKIEVPGIHEFMNLRRQRL